MDDSMLEERIRIEIVPISLPRLSSYYGKAWFSRVFGCG